MQYSMWPHRIPLFVVEEDSKFLFSPWTLPDKQPFFTHSFLIREDTVLSDWSQRVSFENYLKRQGIKYTEPAFTHLNVSIGVAIPLPNETIKFGPWLVPVMLELDQLPSGRGSCYMMQSSKDVVRVVAEVDDPIVHMLPSYKAFLEVKREGLLPIEKLFYTPSHDEINAIYVTRIAIPPKFLPEPFLILQA